MTCYNCLHYDACSNAGDGGFSCLKEDASKCKYFKNKADYVEVKHGEWVMIPVNGVAEYRCGNIDCCRIIPFGKSPYEMLYCPYCGAKMDGGAE